MDDKGKNGNFTNAGKGRPKGSKNKFTALKDTFLQAFEDIGGVDELANWGKQKENRTAFYQIISKMLPKEIELTGDADRPLGVVILPEKKKEGK